MTTTTPPCLVTAYPPLFGVRRELLCPPLERIDFAASDGSGLCLHHTSGGHRGPVIVTPGTAMTALTYCIDTVPCNFVEFLVAQGFDVWLFDWRTSPLLAVHEEPYTLESVAKYDWPAAVAEVRQRTGAPQVSVMSHCLSSPCFLLSLVRGYTNPRHIRAFVASQVALHLDMTWVGKVKLQTRLDRLLPGSNMIHEKPSHLSGQLSDLAISLLSWVIPKSYSCDNPACHRHSASFGDVILHSRVNAPTHVMMGELIPECLTAFLKDVAVWGRQDSLLTKEDMTHIDRLQLPIFFISGSENKMFVPEATRRSYQLLCEANGQANYQRKVYDGFGHLDCFIGAEACQAIWPDIARALEPDAALDLPSTGSGKQGSSVPPNSKPVAGNQLGITFSETMAGGFTLGETDPSTGGDKGRHSGNILAMYSTITIQDLNRFIADPDHVGRINGSISFPSFGENIPATAGVFNLFSPTDQPGLKLMVYEMAFTFNGQNYYLAGKKEVRDDSVIHMWKETTTLFTQLHQGSNKTGPVVGAGILTLGPLDLMRMVSTMHALNAASPAEGAKALMTFGRFFLGKLWDSYIKKT